MPPYEFASIDRVSGVAAISRGLDWGPLLDRSERSEMGGRVTLPPDDPSSDDGRSPMAIAFEWSATIMTISLEMVVPGLAGYWLDQKLGTRVLFLLIGFALGGTMAALALMRIANKRSGPGGKQDNGKQPKYDRLE